MRVDGWIVSAPLANSPSEQDPMNKISLIVLGLISALAGSCAASVSVSSPTNNSTVSNPMNVVAGASSSAPITAMAVYVDNNLATKVSGGSINTTISVGTGGHSLVIQAWDSNGNVQKQALSVNVTGGTGSLPYSFNNIDQMSGWQNCGACSGAGGNGPTVPYSLTQYRSSPSMDGQANQYWIGGNTPYSSALWWKQLGAQPGATHFIYDLYFYLQNPGVAQSIELDMNQSVNGRKFIFGTQCNIKGTHQWDIWDTANRKWVPSGVGCSQPSAYVWHHAIIETKRVGSQTLFIAITLDGNKSYINRYFNTYAVNAAELNVAVQIDANYQGANYSLWADKISLQYQ